MIKIYDINQVEIAFNGLQLKRLDFVHCERKPEWAERTGESILKELARLAAQCQARVQATGTVFDLYDDAPTQPLPPIPDPGRFTSGMWTPYNEGDELDRTCKKCGNKSMRAVKIDGNWHAFCKLCGKKESL